MKLHQEQILGSGASIHTWLRRVEVAASVWLQSESLCAGSGQRNAAQHCKRMSFVVSVLESADYGGGRSHPLGKFPLTQASLCPESVKQRRNFRVEQFLLISALACRDIFTVNSRRLSQWFSLLSHSTGDTSKTKSIRLKQLTKYHL